MFFLSPHPTPERPQRRSPRMFRIDWIERYLSRVKPIQVVAVWLPISGWLLWRAARDPALGLWAVALGFLGGLFGWTLLEYLLHRFLFHHAFDPASELQRDLGYLIHGVHHDYPWDADRLVMPPVVTAIIAATLWFPVQALAGTHLHPAVFSGITAGYLWYDLTHYALHHGKPRTALGRAQRRYHLVHHFATPHARYGVTTPLWDLLFRTYPGEDDAASRFDVDPLQPPSMTGSISPPRGSPRPRDRAPPERP